MAHFLYSRFCGVDRYRARNHLRRESVELCFQLILCIFLPYSIWRGIYCKNDLMFD